MAKDIKDDNYGEEEVLAQTVADVQDDVKKAKKQRNKEKRAKKRERLSRILNYVKRTTTDPELLADASALTPGFRTTVRTAGKNVIADMFRETLTVHEDDIYKAHKMGRGEMSRIIKKLIKDPADPNDRLWIEFDPTTGLYTLVHRGASAPEGWKGYEPVTIEKLVIE
ncbi:MAG: hypothetical protein P8Y70_00015 [Candidatus Lokiarchaeota archaeon]